jgi:hypothetical protein
MKFGVYLPTRGHTATPEALETLVTRSEALNESLERMEHFASVIKPAADRL